MLTEQEVEVELPSVEDDHLFLNPPFWKKKQVILEVASVRWTRAGQYEEEGLHYTTRLSEARGINPPLPETLFLDCGKLWSQ